MTVTCPADHDVDWNGGCKTCTNATVGTVTGVNPDQSPPTLSPADVAMAASGPPQPDDLTNLLDDPDDEALFVDIAALLAGGLPDPPRPVLLRRADGQCIFYAGKVNVLYGDPECGKTWIALAAIVEALADGRRCVFIDMDHNGAAEIIAKLLLLGAKPADLANRALFRLCEPEDAEDLTRQVAYLRRWRPAVAVVDSLGELLPLLDLSSNSPDDYTRAHNRVLSPLSDTGAAVIGIDHMPKSEDARQHGQTGTLAKKRAVNGVTLMVTLAEQFIPGRGGAANLAINKDRPGGLRGACPPVDKGKKQPAGRFVLKPIGDDMLSWMVTTPRAASETADGEQDAHWKVAAHLADLADQLGVPKRAGRRVLQEKVMAAHPTAKHGSDVWQEAADIRKNRSDVVPDHGPERSATEAVLEIKTKAA